MAAGDGYINRDKRSVADGVVETVDFRPASGVSAVMKYAIAFYTQTVNEGYCSVIYYDFVNNHEMSRSSSNVDSDGNYEGIVGAAEIGNYGANSGRIQVTVSNQFGLRFRYDTTGNANGGTFGACVTGVQLK